MEAVGSKQVFCRHFALSCLRAGSGVGRDGVRDPSEVLSLGAGREARSGWLEEEQSPRKS